MIVIIGSVSAVADGEGIRPSGLTGRIALTAAATGAGVELVTRVGDDAPGDSLLLAFARAGVRHVATLRDASRPTPIAEAALEEPDPDPDDGSTPSERPGRHGEPPPGLDAQDVAMALRYLPDISVVVVVHPSSSAVIREAASGATYAGAPLVVVVPDDAPVDPPTEALVVAAPDDADAVGDVIGRYVAALDAGQPAGDAYAESFGAAQRPDD